MTVFDWFIVWITAVSGAVTGSIIGAMIIVWACRRVATLMVRDIKKGLKDE